MRYFAMQVLTWGTVAAAAGSAVLLAALGGAAPKQAINLSLADVTEVVFPEPSHLRPAEQAAGTEAPVSDTNQVGKR